MANTKLSQIAAAASNIAAGDVVVGVRGGTTDQLFSFAQLSGGIGSGASGITGGVVHGVAITNTATTIAGSVVLAANSFLVGQAGADPVGQTPTQVTALLNPFTATLQGVVTASGGGTANFLRADGVWAAPAGGGVNAGTINQLAYYAAAGSTVSGETLLQAVNHPALTGDVTCVAGTVATVIAANAVNNPKLAQAASNTFKGNPTGSTASVVDMTTTQATALLNQFTTTLQGIVPGSGGGTTNFLRADGTWAAAGGGLPLIGTGATVTTSQPLLDLSQTWNAGAVAFTGVKLNVTNTASSANSQLMQIQLGGIDCLEFFRNGSLVIGTGGTPGGAGTPNAANSFFMATGGTNGWGFDPSTNSPGTSNHLDLLSYNAVFAYFDRSNGLIINSSFGPVGFGTSAVSPGDTLLYRDVAGIFAQRNGVNAQTLRVYNTFTDASNYERGVMDWTTSANILRVGSQAAGTGALRSMALNGSGGALATTATTGFLMIPTCAGTPTGVPANIPTGMVPLVYDTTGNFLWFYNSGWKKSTVYA